MNTTTTGPINPAHKLIDENRWQYMLEVLPPLYIKTLDGIAISNGIACSEPYTFARSVVLTVCYKKDGEYYECEAEVYTEDGKPMGDTYNHCYSTGNIAKTWIRKPVRERE
jgi:hypothetical protein